jgi:import inner membrane translocase subunit TIM50
MFRRSILRLEKSTTAALKRAYTTTPEQPASSSAHKLAEEALAQKTGTAKSKATLPKGDKKPAKAKGEKSSNMKEIALTAGAVTGLGLGTLFYYGKV